MVMSTNAVAVMSKTDGGREGSSCLCACPPAYMLYGGSCAKISIELRHEDTKQIKGYSKVVLCEVLGGKFCRV